ncbi:MAG: tetratricopeptide repeat protein [Proteobacteria bacterium]|nr:tetratricopeptide repeat protein [Pseudomonadota bacterium]
MEARFQQALALQTAGRLDEAEAAYREVLSAGRYSAAWHNLGAILRSTGRLEEAEASFRAALEIKPDRPSSRHGLGMALLQMGRWADGWAHYEARRLVTPMPPAPPLPEWRGEPLKGKRLLVVGEQGQGDQILFARFLARLDASETTLVPAQSLMRLFAQLPVRTARPSAWDQAPADVWTYLGSIPHWLGLTPADAPAPYLSRPARPEAGIGLMLDGGTLTGNNPHRLPPPDAAQAIRGLADFTDLAPEASGAADFADTADLIAGLSRVVTVDTSVAHLAGALGKPVIVLMARPAIDWHSHWADDRSDWYAAMRTIRQPATGDWGSVVEALRPRLAT